MEKTLRNIFKKIFALMLISTLLFSIACKEENGSDRDKFIEEINGVSETYKGTVSTETYPTSQEAAEAFVYEELAGYNSIAIKETKSNKELSEKEINKLNIPDDILKGHETVEEIEVTYLVDDEELTNLSQNTKQIDEKLNKEKKVKVYVIKYGVNWKYFSPMPITGDTINKSYYDSVFNNEKYQNCTLETTSDADVTVTSNGESYQMKTSLKQLIKHADGKVYLEQILEMSGNGQSTIQSIYSYMETQGNYIKCYIKLGENEDWMEADLSTIGFSSLDELTPFYDQYLDYTYFTKTDYGFALADSNAQKYFMDALMGSLESYASFINKDNLNLDMYAEYYVSKGVLSGMNVKASADITISYMGYSLTLNEATTAVIKCTDYGTTKVEKPFNE